MDIDIFLNSMDLKEPTRSILVETEQLTGKPFDFIHNPGLSVQATVKIARSSMSHHIVIFSGTDSSLLNHQIAHECGHIRRYYAAPKDRRLVPESNPQTNQAAIAHIEKNSNNLLKSLPIDLRYQMIPVWINGIIYQVTNLPPDIYIEKWIFERYPELRIDQRRSIGLIHEQASKILKPELHSQFPKIITDSSCAMNYAFYKKIDEITGSTFFKNFKRMPSHEVGESLYHCIREGDGGLVGDIALINEWAGILQIGDWFTWTDFENIPPGYEKRGC